MENNALYKKNERNLSHIFKIIGFVILGVLGALVFAFLFGYFVMLLWNWLMPKLFGFVMINFWQAVGIILLARLIFGGFKHKHDERHNGKFASIWRRKFRSDRTSKNHWYKWKYYDKFWKEEGESVFNEYVQKKKDEKEEE